MPELITICKLTNTEKGSVNILIEKYISGETRSLSDIFDYIESLMNLAIHLKEESNHDN